MELQSKSGEVGTIN